MKPGPGPAVTMQVIVLIAKEQLLFVPSTCTGAKNSPVNPGLANVIVTFVNVEGTPVAVRITPPAPVKFAVNRSTEPSYPNSTTVSEIGTVVYPFPGGPGELPKPVAGT